MMEHKDIYGLPPTLNVRPVKDTWTHKVPLVHCFYQVTRRRGKKQDERYGRDGGGVGMEG